jgi:transposase
METYFMGKKEVSRPGILQAMSKGRMGDEDAVKLLGISERQLRRLKARYREGGARALEHGLRGRRSNQRLSDAVREKVIALLRGTYAGLNDTHFTEKLREHEGLSIGRETVRRIRRELRIPAKRQRRAPKHRSRRLRAGREGMLVQIDGSPFAWLEDRAPEMTLVGAVDDATGKVLGATFRPHEDLHGYAAVFHQVFTTYGLPIAFYGDGTNILVRNDDRWTLEEEKAGQQSPTHLGRVLEECAIRYIRARSPQAKGRIENRWATLQDRLTAELRLRGISTMDAANAFLTEFLKDFNRRFARPAPEVGSAWRRPARNLHLVLSCRYNRVVAGDNTLKLPGHRKLERDRGLPGRDLRCGRPAALPRTIQIPPGPGRRSYAGCRVELRELLDGRLIVLYRGRLIASQPSPPDFELSPRGAARLGCKSPSRAKQLQARIVARCPKKTRPSTPNTPPRSTTNHPWRRMPFGRPRTLALRGADISTGQ